MKISKTFRPDMEYKKLKGLKEFILYYNNNNWRLIIPGNIRGAEFRSFCTGKSVWVATRLTSDYGNTLKPSDCVNFPAIS